NYFPNYRFGERQLRGDLVQVVNGFASHQWISSYLSFGQYFYMYNTLLNANISGLVTVRTAILQPEVFANYNAILTIPDPQDLNRAVGYIPDFVWQFTDLSAI
ncbi:MAG TPA: hypothetical protein VKP88_05160, partial [Candidatus Paceibacterota bacterium]|nr:hypothetical protein [Candidatus Paceibacterota bacterium]